MKKIYTLKCVGGFRDGNVYPEYIPTGTILEDVDERLFHRLTKSDPSGFEVVDVKNIVPPSTKSKPENKSLEEAEAKKTKKGNSDGIES